MRKPALFLACLLLSSAAVTAQPNSSRLRISLLTCGTGPEVWETFGHTALRVTDYSSGADAVYNYGTFEFGDDFALQFMRGKLLYYLSFYPYDIFLDEYESADRSVHEQELLLDETHKIKIAEFLAHNAKPENRYYKYDFFYDNCATRIRDIFPFVLGGGFRFGTTAPASAGLTFRNIINRYYYYKHWERLGINILLGSRIDKVMSHEDAMFLPDYLSEGLSGGTYEGNPVSAEKTQVIPGSVEPPAGINWPFVVFCGLALALLLCTFLPRYDTAGRILGYTTLFVTGLLGVLMLVMWFGTDHQTCAYNTNLLWALPTNLAVPFIARRYVRGYSVFAMILIAAAIALHVFGYQELPLLQLAPLLLALLLIFRQQSAKRLA